MGFGLHGMDNGAKNDVKRPVGHSFLRRWDCSQIENVEEEESWQEGDPWDEEHKLEEMWNEEGWKEVLCSWR